MRRGELPSVFAEYESLGGGLLFSVWEDAEDQRYDHTFAIRVLLDDFSRHMNALQNTNVWHAADLSGVDFSGLVSVDRNTFIGRYWDASRSSFVRDVTYWSGANHVSEVVTIDRLIPILKEHGSMGLGGPSEDEQAEFAYAFGFCHGLEPDCSSSDLNRLFMEISGVIAPAEKELVIRDWSFCDLPTVSHLFQKFRRNFLFTVYDHAERRLFVTAGAEED